MGHSVLPTRGQAQDALQRMGSLRELTHCPVISCVTPAPPFPSGSPSLTRQESGDENAFWLLGSCEERKWSFAQHLEASVISVIIVAV